MGLSQGMTISPNQTLTLNSVDPRFGGFARGILQLGQRTGAAIGTPMIHGIIFSLTESGKAWIEAFIIALTIIVALTRAAMGVSFADRAREKAGKGALCPPRPGPGAPVRAERRGSDAQPAAGS